jgi:hypothetical protein
MSIASIGERATGINHAALTQRRCVAGCGRLARRESIYCHRCGQEMEAVNVAAERRRERETRRAQRLYHLAIQFELLCLRVRQWMWIFYLAVVIAGLMVFFGEVLGQAFCIWMDGAQ